MWATIERDLIQCSYNHGLSISLLFMVVATLRGYHHVVVLHECAYCNTVNYKRNTLMCYIVLAIECF